MSYLLFSPPKKAQATALATTLSAGPPLSTLLPLTGRIWHAHLAASGLLEPGAVAALEDLVSRPARAPTPAALAGVVAAAADGAGRLVAPVAGPRALLSILSLALWVCRAPVTPVDLVRWAGRGELPYYDLTAFAAGGGAAEGGARLVTLPALLRPAGLPTPASLAAGAARLSASLGGLGSRLTAPSTPLIRRWLFELGAPQALLPVAVEVAATAGRAARARGGGAGGAAATAEGLLSRSAAPDTLSSDVRRYPFLGPLAALAVAFKLAYGLGVGGGGGSDGGGGGGNSASSDHPPSPPVLPGLPPPPPAGWGAWAASVVAASTAAPLGTPPTAGQAAGLGPEAAAAYLRWVGAAVFPRGGAADEEGGGGGGDTAAAPWEAAAATLARAGDTSEEASSTSQRPGGAAQPPPRPAATAPPPRLRLPKAPAPPHAWPFAPLSHPDRLRTALPPDYAAVLTALAAHGWVRPAALHAAAAGVEAALLDAEAGVDK